MTAKNKLLKNKFKSGHYYTNQTATEQLYFEASYLASYYRWSARKFGATGSRSPITGKQYNAASNIMHTVAHKAGEKAMAKCYNITAHELLKIVVKQRNYITTQRLNTN